MGFAMKLLVLVILAVGVSPSEAIKRNNRCCSRLEPTITRLQATLSRIQREREEDSETFAAFSVRFTEDIYPAGLQVAPLATLLFDNVTTNAGDAYNPSTGVFTAPTPGIYVFSFKVMGRQETGSFVVEKNGDDVLALVHTKSAEDQGAGQAVAHLEQGDEVYVRQRASIRTVRGGFWTVFTGFLLRAD